MLKFLFVVCLISLLTISSFAVLVNVSGQTSVLSMGGKDWSVSVSPSLQTSLDSKNIVYATVKSSVEKEIFVDLASLKDCTSGKVEFKVNTYGLSIYKQLPLDKELSVGGKEGYTFVNSTVAMIKDKVVVSRPENVVNSFACFDSSGAKVLHIYASQLIDAKGSKVWCDSDLKDGLLTVYLPSNWLESAVFPVVVDPTFGYTVVGASTVTDTTYTIYGCQALTTGDGVVNGISVYLINAAAGEFRCAIYSDVSGEIDTLLDQSISLSAVNGWNYAPLNNNVSVVWGETYWLVFQNQYGGAKWDYTSLNSTGNGFEYQAFPTSLTMGANYYQLFSIYANYSVTPDSTPTPTASPTPTPTASPSPSPTSTVASTSVNPTPTVVIDTGSEWLWVIIGIILMVAVVWFMAVKGKSGSS